MLCVSHQAISVSSSAPEVAEAVGEAEAAGAGERAGVVDEGSALGPGVAAEEESGTGGGPGVATKREPTAATVTAAITTARAAMELAQRGRRSDVGDTFNGSAGKRSVTRRERATSSSFTKAWAPSAESRQAEQDAK